MSCQFISSSVGFPVPVTAMHFQKNSLLQSHRMIEAGRDLWRLSGPTLLLTQGYLEPVAQDHV